MLVSFKVLMLSGNEFHNLGPDTLKERSAKILRFVPGINFVNGVDDFLNVALSD